MMDTARPRNLCAFAGMVVGALSLAVAIFHFHAGPLEPRKSLERNIAEIAVNISKEVWNVARNKPAEVQARTWNADDALRIGTGLAAVLAILLAGAAAVRREDHRPVIVAGVLGTGTIAFQFLTWVALLVCGLILVWIVVANLGEILSAGG